MALYLFGSPQSVSATGFEALERQVDVISAELYYPGHTVTITGGWYHEGYPFSMEFTVTGEAGTMEYHLRDPKPTLYQAGQTPSEVDGGDTDAYRAELEYFLQCAQSGAPPANVLRKIPNARWHWRTYCLPRAPNKERYLHVKSKAPRSGRHFLGEQR